MTTNILADWLSVEEAARVCGVSTSTILAWIRSGKVKPYYFAAETTTIH